MATAEQFPITRVTPRFHRLTKALEKAVLNFQKVSSSEDADLTERTEAWTKVSLAREVLYNYVEYLESRNHKTNPERTIQLRF